MLVKNCKLSKIVSKVSEFQQRLILLMRVCEIAKLVNNIHFHIFGDQSDNLSPLKSTPKLKILPRIYIFPQNPFETLHS